MSSVAVAPSSAPLRGLSAADGRLEVELIAGLAAAERLWRSAERGGEYSPYQRFDWVAAFVSSVTPRADIRLATQRSRLTRRLLEPLAHRATALRHPGPRRNHLAERVAWRGANIGARARTAEGSADCRLRSPLGISNPLSPR